MKYLILILNKPEKIHCTLMAFPGYFVDCSLKGHMTGEMKCCNGKLKVAELRFIEHYLDYIKELIDLLRKT